jgi:hypothetical protein
MSVVGATRWYERVAAGQYNPESDLILNKYCKAFISEVKGLIPTEFYTGYTKHCLIHNDGRMKAKHPFTCFDGECTTWDCSAPSSIDTSGSLMPFGTTGDCYDSNAALWLGNKQAHDSVSSWTIDGFGRVIITRACILAPSCVTLSTARSALNSTVPTTSIDQSPAKEPPFLTNSKPFNIANLSYFHRGARLGKFEAYFVVISSLFENVKYAPGFGVPSPQARIQGIILRAVRQIRGSRQLVSERSFI